MRRSLRNIGLCATAIAFTLVATRARSEEALGAALPAIAPSSAATVPTSATSIWLVEISTTVAALGGTVILVLYLAKLGPWEVKDGGTSHVQVSREEAEKAAGLYLRSLGPSLTDSIATGRGPVVNDWAHALSLPQGHEQKLGELLHAHRGELLELARADGLTDARAAAFLQRLSDLVNEEPVLRTDMEALRASVM